MSSGCPATRSGTAGTRAKPRRGWLDEWSWRDVDRALAYGSKYNQHSVEILGIRFVSKWNANCESQDTKDNRAATKRTSCPRAPNRHAQ